MAKIETDLEEFISETIKQIKSGKPDDCVPSDNIYFDVSVLINKKTGGKLDLILANIDHTTNFNQVHRVKFAIADRKSREENAVYIKNTMHDIFSEIHQLAKLEESNTVPRKRGRPRKK